MATIQRRHQLWGLRGSSTPPQKKISQIPPKWTTTKFSRNCTSSHYYHRTQRECQRHHRLQVRILLTYFTTGNKIAIWHFHCQIWHFSVTWVSPANGISIGLAIFAGLTNVTNEHVDRHTDWPRYSVCSSRPLPLANAAYIRPNNNTL